MNSTLESTLRGTFDAERNAYLIEEEPAILHCHHYNCYLQAVILDTVEYLPEVHDILIDAAHEIAYSQFTKLFEHQKDLEIPHRKILVEDYYRFAGYGLIDLSQTQESGGIVKTKSEHYAIGWKSKFSSCSVPISFFTTGFLAGAIEAIYGLDLGSLTGDQRKCIAMGDEVSEFHIFRATNHSLFESVGEGTYQFHSINQPLKTRVDYSAIREALVNMPIEGDINTGLIDAFGVLLTRHYANYYCNISNAFLNLFKLKMGNDGLATAIDLLTEAGHVCAFNTFGGIMQSNEWNGMIRPMLDDSDDWIHGIVAVVNALGWGFWEVDDFVPNELLRLRIFSGYEANNYLKKYGESSVPISFLATGGTAGIMNLIYELDLPNKSPITLDDDVYKKIYQGPHFFTAKQLKCRAMGDTYDLIEARRK